MSRCDAKMRVRNPITGEKKHPGCRRDENHGGQHSVAKESAAPPQGGKR